MDSDEDDFMQEAEQKAKKNYLREEILDMNYDIDLITEFFTAKVPSGTSDGISFEGLTDIVREFKGAYRAGVTLEAAKEERRKAEEKERRLYDLPPKKVFRKSVVDDNQVSVPKERNVRVNRTIAGPEAKRLAEEAVANNSASIMSNYSVPCTLLPENALSLNEELNIALEEPEQVKGGLFSADYTTYKLTTWPMGWIVRRRYSDFKWLREALVTVFPGVFIQPTPPKRSRGRLKTENIEKRMKFLHRFVNGLLRNPLLLRSDFLLEFLRERDLIQFQKFRKKHKKPKRPEIIQSIMTITGVVECNTGENVAEIIKFDETWNSQLLSRKNLSVIRMRFASSLTSFLTLCKSTQTC